MRVFAEAGNVLEILIAIFDLRRSVGLVSFVINRLIGFDLGYGFDGCSMVDPWLFHFQFGEKIQHLIK
jgi:hypothetical protein